MSGATDKTNELVNIVSQLDAGYEKVRDLHSQLDAADAAVLSLHGALDAKYEEVKASFTGGQSAPVAVPTTEQPAPSDQVAHY